MTDTNTHVNTETGEIVAAPPKAPSVLLMGEMGAGKTTAIRSLLSLGYEVFMLALAPGWEDILGDCPSGDGPGKLHVKYIPAYGGTLGMIEGHTFDTLLDAAKLLNTTSHDTIQKEGGKNKQNHQQIWDVIKNLNNFHDDRTDKEYGDVSKWDHTRVLFLDDLSALNNMAIRCVVGDKPFLELRDYAAIQFLIQQIVNGLCYRTNAWFVMAAHLERETNPNTGAVLLMVSTVGKALAPALPRFFSDAIHAKMTVTNGVPKWTWNTLSSEVTVKTRNLPMKEGLAPDFKLLDEMWKKRVGLIK